MGTHYPTGVTPPGAGGGDESRGRKMGAGGGHGSRGDIIGE
jgi:hypothetical protein